MSEKFNLKTYQKINGNQHIDSRLQQDHEKAPDEINEKQLDDYRGKEPEVLTEEQLERSRKATKTTEATEVTERLLDTSKDQFGVKHRNASAYEGDLPKLEEQRLKGDPVENEKYEDASETPKQMRWWEQGGKSPDGLKVAQKKSATQKTAQYDKELTFDRPRFEETLEEDVSPLEYEGEEAEEEAAINPLESIKEEYEIEDISDFEQIPDIEEGAMDDKPPMYVIKEKDLLGDIPAVYMVIGYSVEDFGDDELAIKQAALDKVLEERPELEGIIDISDFSGVKAVGNIGEVTLRSLDPRLSNVLVDASPEVMDEEGFEEVSYNIEDMGGTPMASGELVFGGEISSINRDDVIEEALEYIRANYGIEDITEDSLDLSLLDEGKVAFLIEAPEEELLGTEASVGFPIIEVTADVKKN